MMDSYNNATAGVINDDVSGVPCATEARWRRTVNNLPVIVYQFSMTSEGVFAFPFVSEVVMPMVGVSAKAAMLDSSRLLGMIHPDDRESFYEGVLKSAECLQPFEARFRIIKDDDTRWLEVRSTPERMADGSILWDGFVVDITRIKQTEMAIREYEENLQSFFNTITGMLFIARLDGGIVHANRTASLILGYSADELTSMHILDLCRASDRRKAENILSEILWGERESCPLPMAAKDGNTVPVDTRIWFGKWAGESCIFVVSKDLSAEQEAQQRFERLFHNNPALMAVSSLPDRKFIEVNSAFLITLGYERNEIIGRTASELDFFVDHKQQEAVKKTLAAEGRLDGYELRVRCKDGTSRNGLLSGEIIRSQGHDCFLTVVVDITERKIALAELQHRLDFERRVREIVSELSRVGGRETGEAIDRALASIGAFIGGDRAYVFQFTNGETRMDNTHEWCAEGIEPQMAQLKGIRFDTELPYFARHIRKREIFHVSDVAALPAEARHEREHFRTQGIRSLIVFPMETPGSLLGFIGFDTVHKCRNWTGNDQFLLQCIANTIGYVIERTQSEVHRFDMERRLAQMEKTESLSRLAGGIAHNFNNMLAAVIGNLELLRDDLPPNMKDDENLDEAEQAAHRAAEMGALMLTFLGQLQGNPVALDLAKLCRARLAKLQADIPAGVDVAANLSEPGPVIQADPDQTAQVIDILITNAREAIPNDSGELRVSIDTVIADKIPEKYRFPMEWKPSARVYACLAVMDTGCGIAPESISNSFDPFYTDKFTGRGMGLAVALGIVKAIGGGITVESKPGCGSTFRVFWPLSF